MLLTVTKNDWGKHKTRMTKYHINFSMMIHSLFRGSLSVKKWNRDIICYTYTFVIQKHRTFSLVVLCESVAAQIILYLYQKNILYCMWGLYANALHNHLKMFVPCLLPSKHSVSGAAAASSIVPRWGIVPI